MKIKVVRFKTIAEQVGAMRSKYPDFKTTFDKNYMRVEGKLKPTSRSTTYQFLVEYTLENKKKEPYNLKVWIISPELKKNEKGEDIPHLYKGGNLCLYVPDKGRKEFSRTDFLYDTVISWTSLWLYYYENWHINGTWDGGGEHPNH